MCFNYNFYNKREVDKLENEYKETEEKLRGLYRENERIEESIDNLETKISEGENEFEKEKNEMNIVLNESLRLTALDASTQQNYVKTKAEIIEKTRTAVEQSTLQAEKLKELKEKQSLMQDSLKEVFTNYKRIQEDVAAVYRM
jgi:chromosome segregation ATPase